MWRIVEAENIIINPQGPTYAGVSQALSQGFRARAHSMTPGSWCALDEPLTAYHPGRSERYHGESPALRMISYSLFEFAAGTAFGLALLVYSYPGSHQARFKHHSVEKVVPKQARGKQNNF